MLSNTEIEARNLIVEQIEKLIEKAQKKATKERDKVLNASVTYKGVVYESESDLLDAYGCDYFSSETYDRLLEKLNKARGEIDTNEMTPSEQLVHELYSIKYNIEREVSDDKRQKEQQEIKNNRIKELAEEGYSIREIEAIIGNEELMRYE